MMMLKILMLRLNRKKSNERKKSKTLNHYPPLRQHPHIPSRRPHGLDHRLTEPLAMALGGLPLVAGLGLAGPGRRHARDQGRAVVGREVELARSSAAKCYGRDARYFVICCCRDTLSLKGIPSRAKNWTAGGR